MNDFELHYIHKARTAELIAEAENERRASRARAQASREGRREGLATRAAKALRRKEEPATETAHRFQLAK